MLAHTSNEYKAQSVATGGARHGEQSGVTNLEIRTHNVQLVQFPPSLSSFDQPSDGGYWRIDLDIFGEDKPGKPYIEVQAISYEQKPYKKLKKKRKEKLEGEEEKKMRKDMDYEDLLRSVCRSKKEMRKKVLMMRADRMLTLTTREGVEDRGSFLKIMDRFRRIVQKHFGKDEFQAVVVLELQERGAYHAHMALNKFYNIKLLRGFWTKALTGKYWHKGCDWEMPGNVQMSSPRKGFWNRHKISKYMAKYMAKEFEDHPISCKRYTSWGKIDRPARVTIYMPRLLDPHYFIKKEVEYLMGVKLKPGFETTVAGFELIWFCVDTR